MINRAKILAVLLIANLIMNGCNKDENPTSPKQTIRAATSKAITDIVASNEMILIGTYALHCSEDGGKNWKKFDQSNGLPRGATSAICISDNSIWVAAGFDTLPDQGNLPAGGGLSYSLNAGQTWVTVPQPGPSPVQNITYDIAMQNNTVWIASFGGGLRKSENFGDTWQVVPPDSFFFNPGKNLNHRVFSVINGDGVLWVGTALGVNKSVDGGLTWANFNHQNQDAPISGNFIVALAYQKYKGKSIIWAASWPTTSESGDMTEFYAVSRSENGGLSWATHLPGEMVHNFAFNDSAVYAASDNGVFLSVDGGVSWEKYSNIIDSTRGLTINDIEFYSVCYVNDPDFLNFGLWIGGSQGLAHTIDNGKHWDIFEFQMNTKKILSSNNECLIVHPTKPYYSFKPEDTVAP